MGRRRRHNRQLNDSFGCVVFILCNLIALSLIYAGLDDDLPAPKPESVPPSEFSEERALIHIQKLASFGIRTVGSFSNEIRSPNYILDYIENVNQTMHEKYSPSQLNKVEIDAQKVVSGTFALEHFLGGFVNSYQNITNILVRISNPDKPESLNNAILISAHYDTALGCSGMSDDGINVAVMMELVRNLLIRTDELNVAIILNFNGGEETILQAAHGFITNHPWSSSIQLFINLEASGAGGTEILFQVTANNGWMVDAYRRSAIYPHAQSIGNVIFSSGLIPSLTDFTVYADYGEKMLPGLDFAFAENGWVYHTTRDDVDAIDIGSLQHCGENMLSLVRTLNNDLNDPHSYFSKHLAVKNKHEIQGMDKIAMYDDYVFYDFFGLTMVAYPYTVATVMHIVACLLFFYVLLRYFWSRHIVYFMKRILYANICGVLTSMVVGVFSFMYIDLTWFSYPTLTIPTFGLPCIAGVIWTHHWLHGKSSVDKTLSPLQLETFVIMADALWWYIMLILITVFLVGISVITFFWCSAFLVVLFLRLFLLRRLQRNLLYIYDVIHCAAFILPMMVIHLLSKKILNVFIPIMGRAGNEVPSDLVIAIIIAVFICMICSGGIHFVYRLKATSRTLLCVGFGVLTLLCLLLNSMHNVYTVRTPKRLWIQSVARHWFNGSKDAALWFNAPDSLSMEPLKHIGIDQFDRAQYVNFNHYEQPWFLPIDEMITKSMYVSVEFNEMMQHIPQKYRTTVKVINQSTEQDGVKTYFHVHGPSHFTVRIDTSMVKEWSFPIPVFRSSKYHDPTVFVFLANGYKHWIRVKDEQFKLHEELLRDFNKEEPVRSDMIFWLKTSANTEGTPFMFTLSGHHINGEYSRTTLKKIQWVDKEIMSKLPEWVDYLPFVSEMIEIRI